MEILSMFRSLVPSVVCALVVTSAVAAQERAPAEGSPAEAFEARVQEGMAYNVLRAQVLSAGWTASGDEDCARAQGADLCEALPELDACSSDGYCLMTFVHPDEDVVLRVATYGDILRWRTPGEEADVAVSNWGYE